MKKWLKFRICSIVVLFVVLSVALVSRAFQLQILSGEALKEKAERQHTKILKLQSERGQILDRNGNVLAASLMVDSVYADPSMIGDTDKVSVELSYALGIRKDEIRKKLSKNGKFSWIARKISPEQSRCITALNIEGVHLVKEPKRFYPNKGLAGHLLGFVGIDSEGLAGLELRYNEYLKSLPKRISWGKDARGHRFYMESDSDNVEDQGGGYNLILTIDSRIQHIVEVQLREATETTGARGGIAIVMDPRTGEVLAMTCEPGFNPNVFSRYSQERWKNKAIADCFDPGSIFKPFLIAAALEEGVVKENDIFNCEKGAYSVGNRIIHEAEQKKYDKLTLREILLYSSNIGSTKVAELLGKERFYRQVETFGFGSKTDIDLPGEASGILREAQKWTDVDLATIAFGQGVSVTAIQIASAMSAIANRGIMMKPYVVRGVIDGNGKVVQEFNPSVAKMVLSPVTARSIKSFLTDVVGCEGGTGRNARIENVSVAGKTGTSQKFDFDAGTYSSESVTASFVGFFPAEEPRMVVLVVLDEPELKRWGGQAAAPVFRNISEQILRCFNKEVGERELVASEVDMEVTHVSNPGITVDRIEMDASVMPDFKGMTMAEVVSMARKRNIDIKIAGSGWAIEQKPVSGSPIAGLNQCSVIFSPGY